MSETVVQEPNKTQDLSSTWMTELKQILGKKSSKKKLPRLAGQMQEVANLVNNLLPKELDIGDSEKAHVNNFEKAYEKVHKLLQDLKSDYDHDLDAFAGEYQAIVSAARDAKDEMSPTLLNLVLADLKEFKKKIEAYKKEFTSQDRKHEDELASVSKEAVKGIKKTDEAKLKKLEAEYGFYSRSIIANLSELKQLSAEESEAFMVERNKIEEPLSKTKNESTLTEAVNDIKALEAKVRQRTIYGQITKKTWDETCKAVHSKIEDARSCLPLTKIKQYNEQFAKIGEKASGENEYLAAAMEMRDLRLDVEAQSTESKRWQVIYKQLSDLCSEQVKQVDKIASPSLSDQMRGEFFEARQFGTLYEFQMASERLASLAPRMAKLIEETTQAKQSWANDKKQYATQITQRLNDENLDEKHPLRLKILAEAEMLYWMGDTQRAYQQAKEGLDFLLKDTLQEIREHIDIKAKSKSDDDKQLQPFIDRCTQVKKRIEELKKLLSPSDSGKSAHVETLEQEYLAIRWSIDGANGEQLPQPALGKTLGVASKRLAEFDKQLDGLMGDSDDAKQNLKSLQDQEAAWKIYAPLWKDWTESRQHAQGFLDTFARVGGEEYLGFRKTFEDADEAAKNAAAKFQEYLKMFPLTDKNQGKAQKLFAEVQQALKNSHEALGGDFKNTGKDDNYRAKLTKAAVAAQLKLDESLKVARKKLKEVVFDAKGWADDLNWDLLPSFCKGYRDRGKQEIKEAEVFEKSTCPGAIETAIKTVELIASEFEEMLNNVPKYQEVGQKLHEVEKLLDDHDLKKCCPTLRDELKKRFKEEVRVDMGKVDFAQADRQLATFRKQSLEPALAKANHIAKSREAGKEIVSKIETLIKELAKKLNLPKGEMGAYSDLLERRGETLKKTEDDEVAKQAVFSLTQLLENLTKDSAQPDFADKVKGQIQTREKNAEEREKRVKEFEQRLDTFLKDEYELAKRSSQATKASLKLIKQTSKTARKLAQEGEFASADEQLNTMRQLAADLIGAPEIKPITNPKKFIENWDTTMGQIHSQLTELKQEIDSAVKEHFGQQPEKAGGFEKAFEPLMKKLIKEFEPGGEQVKVMGTALTTLGSVKATLSDMKRERERALAVLRHFKMLIAKNPLLHKLQKHPFNTKVGVVGLNKMLNEIEYQVVVTT